MSSLTSAEAVIEAALALRGADRMVVIVHDGSDAEVRFANNSVTTNGVRRTRTTTVIVIVERDGGSAAGAATRTGNVDVADLVVAARFEAQSAPLSSDAFELVAPVVDGDVGAPAAMNDLSVLDPVLGSLAGVISRAAERDVTLAGFAEHQLQTTTIGTSTGLRRRHVQPTGAFTLVGRADGGRRSAWLGAGTADFSDIDLATFEESLHRRLEWSRQSFELPAGRYETLMPSSAVADMMAYAYWMAQGQDSEDGRTVFSKAGGGTRVGDTLSALPFTLRSNPAEVGIESTPFVVASASSGSTSVYDNGLALAPTSWIENGRVATLQYHRAGAQRSAVAATAAIDNLVLELPGATGSLDDMIVSTERGLLLTCLWYIRIVDPATLLLTGLTRDGVYLVENGQVRGQVNNFRFNESPIDLLARANEAGVAQRTLGREFGEYLNRTIAPPLRIPDFNMSSVSPAS